MPRRRRTWDFAESSDPRGLVLLMQAYTASRRARGQAESHVRRVEWILGHFILWCHERAVLRAAEVTKPMLDRYQRHLFAHRQRGGQPLSARSQYAQLQAIRLFFSWLVRSSYLESNPASELELPRLPSAMPRNVLTIEEVERVMAGPDVATVIGLRDRAMLETLYGTGVRRSELARLSIYDVAIKDGTLRVWQGKGKKDRTVPLGERAGAWIESYLAASRPVLACEPDSGALFISYKGTPLVADVISDQVRGYLEQAGITKPGACHVFRHTAATLMLEGGADIRYIQEFLGHTNLSTTQIYTRVSIQKLKAVHAATHPGARLRATAVAAAASQASSAGAGSPAADGEEAPKL